MPSTNKFLSLAVQMNKITPDVKKLVIDEQNNRKWRNEKSLYCGEFLVRRNLISNSPYAER